MRLLDSCISQINGKKKHENSVDLETAFTVCQSPFSDTNGFIVHVYGTYTETQSQELAFFFFMKDSELQETSWKNGAFL